MLKQGLQEFSRVGKGLLFQNKKIKIWPKKGREGGGGWTCDCMQRLKRLLAVSHFQDFSPFITKLVFFYMPTDHNKHPLSALAARPGCRQRPYIRETMHSALNL